MCIRDRVTQDQIDADQAEVDDAVDAIDRINDATRFAGTAVFQDANIIFHIGEGDTSGAGSADEVELDMDDVAAATLSLDTIQTGGADDLSTDATGAIGVVDAAITTVSTLRARLGAFQKNKLQTNINSLSVSLENVTATESYIRDTNMAEETSEYTRNQILVQAGVSVLAQANVSAQSVLQLLG